jgi:hypothetical protein
MAKSNAPNNLILPSSNSPWQANKQLNHAPHPTGQSQQIQQSI